MKLTLPIEQNFPDDSEMTPVQLNSEVYISNCSTGLQCLPLQMGSLKGGLIKLNQSVLKQFSLLLDRPHKNI